MLMAMQHKPIRIAAILAACVVFLLTIVINALSASVGQQIGLFLNNTGDISAAFETDVTPAGWTFSIWGFIYTWQGLFLAYSLATLCRKKSGTFLYLSVDYLPSAIFALYTVSNCCNIVWLFLWDRQYVIAALPVIALNPFFLYLVLFVSFRSLYKSIPEMVKIGLTRDVWLTRFLVHNAVAMYATWVTIATLLNLAIVLSYRAEVDRSTAGSASLSIVAAEVLVWAILDNTVLDKYTRYTFSPYIVMIVAFAGIIDKNFNPETSLGNSAFTATLLAVAILLFIVKVCIMVYRHIRHPITPPLTTYNNF